MEKSLFVVLDGIDGSGKGEVIRSLEKNYQNKYKILVTAEPTDGMYGKEIRRVLREEKDPLSNKEKLLDLYLKDRNDHLTDLILPFLKNNKKGIIFCDRYYYSTIVYQKAQGVPLKTVIEKNKKFLMPDICFILDLPADAALIRVMGRGEKEKFERLEFMKKIRQGFLDLKKNIKDNIRIIDASKSKEEVFQSVKKEIDVLLI